MDLLGYLWLLESLGLLLLGAFKIIVRKDISSYPDFISATMTRSRFMNNVICNIVDIFLLISFIVMVAGFSAYFSQEFNLNYIFGAILISVLAFITFMKNINGIVKINTFFIPFLIVIIIILGFKNLKCFEVFPSTEPSFSFNWIISAILYSCYNLIICLPILISLKPFIKSTKQANIVAFLVSLFLLILALIIFFIMNYYYEEVKYIELPTVYISSASGPILKYLTGFAIIGAIFTTAISSGYGFLNNLKINNKKTYILINFLLCTISIFLSNIGFSTLLNILYPILGVLRFNTNYFYIIFFKNTLKKMRFIDISI